ncbi:hypothetical protein BCR43DRAFT_482670, partial [Syncephalastrum racemosum]
MSDSRSAMVCGRGIFCLRGRDAAFILYHSLPKLNRRKRSTSRSRCCRYAVAVFLDLAYAIKNRPPLSRKTNVFPLVV